MFLIFSSFIFFIIFLLFLIIYFQSNTAIIKNVSISHQNADITKPKFSINSDKQKISVTANQGNFLTTDEIMLEKNVIFKSNKFQIYGDNVVFNKKNLVASSNEDAKFVSKNALINSVGFDITENGNILNFKGKTKLILK
tara:strand:- start:338 stop:757 length:420 start_codon:yes stop_codon:yes gene_type:complete